MTPEQTKTRQEMSNTIKDPNGTIELEFQENTVRIIQDDDWVYVNNSNIPELIAALQKTYVPPNTPQKD